MPVFLVLLANMSNFGGSNNIPANSWLDDNADAWVDETTEIWVDES